MTRQEGKGRRTCPVIYKVVHGIQMLDILEAAFSTMHLQLHRTVCREHSFTEEEVMKIPVRQWQNEPGSNEQRFCSILHDMEILP